MATQTLTRSALLVGAAVCAGSLGCDAPESGSLENVKNRKAAPLDNKVDYKKLDYGKLDYSRLDYSKLDPSKLDAGMFGKLSEEQRTAFAAKNIGLVSSKDVNAELERRLSSCRAGAEKAGDKELIASLDRVLEAVKLNSSLINEDLCW